MTTHGSRHAGGTGRISHRMLSPLYCLLVGVALCAGCDGPAHEEARQVGQLLAGDVEHDGLRVRVVDEGEASSFASIFGPGRKPPEPVPEPVPPPNQVSCNEMCNAHCTPYGYKVCSPVGDNFCFVICDTPESPDPDPGPGDAGTVETPGF